MPVAPQCHTKNLHGLDGESFDVDFLLPEKKMPQQNNTHTT